MTLTRHKFAHKDCRACDDYRNQDCLKCGGTGKFGNRAVCKATGEVKKKTPREEMPPRGDKGVEPSGEGSWQEGYQKGFQDCYAAGLAAASTTRSGKGGGSRGRGGGKGVCRDFANGTCTRGSSCRFAHTGAE